MKKGQVFNFIIFLIVATVIIFAGAVLVPLGTDITTNTYEIADMLLDQANSTLNTIIDTDLKDPMLTQNQLALGATDFNKLIITAVFQWGWLIILILTTVVLYLAITSRTVADQRRFI